MRKIKIGILTFTTGDNYGQRLQNYAMQLLFSDVDIDAVTIRKYDYRLSVKHSIKMIINSFLGKQGRYKYKKHLAFKKFDKKYIRYHTKVVANSNNDLSDSFSIFVSGSDQIWSPYSGDVDEFYFQSFAKSEQRFSYAASLACEGIPIEKYPLYQKYLPDFRMISVREEKSKELLSGLVDRKDIRVDLDPTLLIGANAWRSVSKRPRKMLSEKYILVYSLGALDNSIIEYIKNSGFAVINLTDYRTRYSSCGPEEFLYLINNAEEVITDSYHGTIFSLIFNKKVTILSRADNLNDMSSRFDTLYNKIGLRNIKTFKLPDSKAFQSSRDDALKYINAIKNAARKRGDKK